MRFSIRQFVLASAVLAAWQVLGGGDRALADYVSAVSLNRGSEIPTALAFDTGHWESDCASGASASDVHKEKPCPEPSDREQTGGPLSFVGLFQTSWHFGGAGDAGGSTGSSSVNGPSTQQVGTITRFEFAAIDVVGSVEPDDWLIPSPSITSRLFRPPRAV